MSLIGKRALTALCGILLSAQLSAQTRFCIGGDLDHMSGAQRASCVAKVNQIRVATLKYRAPEDWHFVVVCSEASWAEYAAFSKRTRAELDDLAADTDLDQRTTFFRADRLLNPAQGNSVEQVVSYEIAGITLGSTEKTAIQRLLASWKPEPKQEARVLRASR